jgi:hypothetical protein
MNQTQIKTAAAVALAAAIPLGMQWNANRNLRAELDRVQHAQTEVRNDQPSVPAAAGPQGVQPVFPALTSPSFLSAVPHDWEQALSEADPVLRSRRIAQLLAMLTPDQAPQVAEVFQRADPSGARFSDEYRLFLRAWGSLDGPAAIAHLTGDDRPVNNSHELQAALADWAGWLTPDGRPNPRLRELQSALAGWAAADLENARFWTEALPDGREKERLIGGLLDGWSLNHFEGAAAYAESRPQTSARDEFGRILLERSLAAGGSAAARQWVERIPDDELNRFYKQRAFDKVVRAMLEHEPAAAAQWIEQYAGHSVIEGKGKAVAEAATRLAREDPFDAMRWLGSLELPATQHADALSRIMSTWGGTDPGAAGSWLNQNPEHPNYDVLADRYARAIAPQYPQPALAWAQSINEEKRRDGVSRAVSRVLFAELGDAAAPILMQAGIDPNRVERLSLDGVAIREGYE